MNQQYYHTNKAVITISAQNAKSCKLIPHLYLPIIYDDDDDDDENRNKMP
jgi:hypothetical protein